MSVCVCMSVSNCRCMRLCLYARVHGQMCVCVSGGVAAAHEGGLPDEMGLSAHFNICHGKGTLLGQANTTPNSLLPTPVSRAPNLHPAGKSPKHFLSNQILSSLQQVQTPRRSVSISPVTPLPWTEVTQGFYSQPCRSQKNL